MNDKELIAELLNRSRLSVIRCYDTALYTEKELVENDANNCNFILLGLTDEQAGLLLRNIGLHVRAKFGAALLEVAMQNCEAVGIILPNGTLPPSDKVKDEAGK